MVSGRRLSQWHRRVLRGYPFSRPDSPAPAVNGHNHSHGRWPAATLGSASHSPPKSLLHKVLSRGTRRECPKGSGRLRPYPEREALQCSSRRWGLRQHCLRAPLRERVSVSHWCRGGRFADQSVRGVGAGQDWTPPPVSTDSRMGHQKESAVRRRVSNLLTRGRKEFSDGDRLPQLFRRDCQIDRRRRSWTCPPALV